MTDRPVDATSARQAFALHDVCAIVVHYQRFPAVFKVVDGLLAAGIPAEHIFVIDNGSPSGAEEVATARYGENLWLRQARNGGYAAAVNVGVAEAIRLRLPLALIVTHEVVIGPDSLDTMLATFAKHERLGVVAPISSRTSTPDVVWSAGGRIGLPRLEPKNLYQGEEVKKVASDCTQRVDWVEGCCFLARVEALESVGLMDEGYFLYFEEVDLCVRLRRRGWSVMIAANALVLQEPGHMPRYLAIRNRVRLARKLFPWTGLPFILMENLARLTFAACSPAASTRQRAADRARAVIDGMHRDTIEPSKIQWP